MNEQKPEAINPTPDDLTRTKKNDVELKEEELQNAAGGVDKGFDVLTIKPW
jgi:hypothetical protein